MFLLITMVIFLIIVFLILASFAYGGLLAAPYVPMWKKDIHRALELAKIKPNETLYDLGSGDGRIIIEAVKGFKAKAIGYEIALLPYLYSYVKIKLMGIGNDVSVKMGNFFEHDLGNANIVTAFLSTRAMAKLKDKFEKELKPGTRVISFVFHIDGWTPEIIDKPKDKDLPIYLYRVK